MYLIAGGAGFLGKHLAERLIRGNASAVRIFDLRREINSLPDAEYTRGDVTDFSQVETAIKGCSVVFNLVSLLPCSRGRREFFRVNVEGTRNICAAALMNKVGKIVHVSTSIVYGIPAEIPLTEESPVKPVGDYGRSKLLAEDVCREYIKKGLNLTILRPRFIVGPGRLGLLTILFDWLSRGKNIYTIGSGANRFQMVSVYDLARACLLAAGKGGCGVYNIGADNVPTVRELLSALAGHAGTNSRVIPVNARLAKFLLIALDRLNLAPLGTEHYFIADKDYILDTSKAKVELGWLPEHGQIEMMNSAYDWYIAHREELRAEIKADFPQEKILKVLKYLS
jgi:nucleoside-diphosphate-sugar epimerase